MTDINLTAGLDDGTTTIDVASRVPLSDIAQQPTIVSAHARMLADRIVRALGLPIDEQQQDEPAQPEQGAAPDDDIALDPRTLFDLIYACGKPLTGMKSKEGDAIDLTKTKVLNAAEALRGLGDHLNDMRQQVSRVVDELQKAEDDELAEVMSNRLADLDERLAALRLV